MVTKVHLAVQNGNGNDHEEHEVSGLLEASGRGAARSKMIMQVDRDAKMEG